MKDFLITRRELLALAGIAGVFAGRSRNVRLHPMATPAMLARKNRGLELQRTLIWASAPETPTTHFVAFRKQFTLPHYSKDALLHLFADVRYLLWVNGQYVTRGPARFNPKGPEYDTISVTKFLKVGVNTISVLVMANASNGKMMHHKPGLTASLETAGEIILSTDPTWKWSGQTRYGTPLVEWGNVRDQIDTRMEDGDWTLPEYNDAHWQTAIFVEGTQWGLLTPRRIPLLRETPLKAKIAADKTLPVTLTAGQEISFDLGRLSQAYTTLDIDADADTALTLSHAGISYTARAGRQTYMASDTCGFETGTLYVNTGRVTVHEFGAVERLYPFDCVGSFHSNDPLLNDIWAMCARSVQVMSEDSYVDCADRERTEWMDCDPPAFAITQTAFAGPGLDGKPLYADPRLLEELLRRTALTQQPAGWVKAHTCSDRFDIHAYMEDRSCDWVQGTRRYYESTHDANLIREVWPVIVTQIDWFLDHRTARGLVHAREWVVWGNPMGYQICEGTGLNAFVYKALVDAAYLAGVIGEKTQAVKYGQAAQDLAAAFNTILWNETSGTYYSGFYAEGDKNTSKLKVTDGLAEPTMFPSLWALDQGIVPEARRERVIRYLLANRQQASRVMTFYYLFKQMYTRQDALLDREVLDTLRTKWRDMAETGWKLSWEEFEGGSKAHIYGVFPGYFLSAYVLGVRRNGPIWEKKLMVEPRLGGLTQAEGTVITEFGPVPVMWKIADSRLNFHVTIPAGVTATLSVPQSGTKADMRLDGKPVKAVLNGHQWTVSLESGSHTGSLHFVTRLPPPSALVTARTSITTQAAFEADLLKVSLIGIGQPTYLATMDEKCTNGGGSSNTDALRNGTTFNGSGGSDTMNDGATYRGYGTGDTATFRLETLHHPAGYDITKIGTFAGHSDGRASQKYEVSVAFVSAPSEFVVIVPVAVVDCGGGSSEIILQHPHGKVLAGPNGKAEGVAAIRFDFLDGPLGFNVYREIQIAGKATVAEQPR